METKSDLERFLELYASFGFECVVNTLEDGRKTILLGDCPSAGEVEGERVTKDRRLIGYSGFYTRYVFSPAGGFIEQGAFE